MKVKNLSVDKVREGMCIVAKANGTYGNGSVFTDVKKVGENFLQLRKMKRSAFDFICDCEDRDQSDTQADTRNAFNEAGIVGFGENFRIAAVRQKNRI